MADTTNYDAAEVTAWLTDTQAIGARPARQAGRVIAAAWNGREFYASATLPALAAALRAAERPVSEVDQVADALARAFGVHLHDVAAWDPRPDWRKEIGA
ncbi:hypothetical protein [Amycolatopsis rifamycinica]|uniref:Uncharacterized protein n=1 Tax=Amycolatopsis rifamycinica TaxID=287986 RepID=A0A066UG93_9PSEU|nr:hypothetical protein [Amycolatopsis rifamycinica]KDN23208.1 hypothetical protein DV20_05685 [Amycolatopsis rifamycinica]